MSALSAVRADGTFDWAVTETPVYRRALARSLARMYAKATPEQQAAWDRYDAMLAYARAQGRYPAKQGEEARLMVWWRDTASAALTVEAGYAYYVSGGR